MSIVKPYTFVAGNKARANEVNEDFDVLYQQVNANITNIANVEEEIQTLSSTKANVNGDSTQRFAVADPVSSGDAVNKRTLFKQIANSIDYIGGLTISKDSGSPNDTILIDPGAAYDSLQEVVLKLDVLTSKQNTAQSANATYYVYIIGSDTGSSIDILISTEPSVPTLPVGYTLYRNIGKYTTDSSAHIDYIFNADGRVINQDVYIIRTYISGYSGYILFNNGYKIQWGQFSNSNRTDGKGPWQYYPIAYSSAPVVVATVCTDTGYITEDWRITDIATNRFRGLSSENVRMNWISIGV